LLCAAASGNPVVVGYIFRVIHCGGWLRLVQFMFPVLNASYWFRLTPETMLLSLAS
jgi:hypothetical protein